MFLVLIIDFELKSVQLLLIHIEKYSFLLDLSGEIKLLYYI